MAIADREEIEMSELYKRERIAEGSDCLDVPLYQDGGATRQVCTLKLSGIVQILAEDSQGIDVYDLNKIFWDPTAQKAFFKLNIPATLEIFGANLEMSI